MIAVAGGDFPDKYIKLLREKGVNTTGLEIKNGKTFCWSGRYDNSLDNVTTLRTELNLFKDFTPTIPMGYRNEEVVFLANIDPQLQLNVLNQIKNPRLAAADTISLWINKKKKKLLEVLKRVDVFIINAREAQELTGEHNLIKAAKAIISYGTDAVILKRGIAGTVFMSKDDFFTLPAYCLERIQDTTGAGDVFAGGFLGYLSTKRRYGKADIRKAVAYGTVMASFNVEKFDIKGLLKLNRGKIGERFKGFKRMCSF
jgi:sugar/nucleoside kinase (ribokinase family)